MSSLLARIAPPIRFCFRLPIDPSLQSRSFQPRTVETLKLNSVADHFEKMSARRNEGIKMTHDPILIGSFHSGISRVGGVRRNCRVRWFIAFLSITLPSTVSSNSGIGLRENQSSSTNRKIEQYNTVSDLITSIQRSRNHRQYLFPPLRRCPFPGCSLPRSKVLQ